MNMKSTTNAKLLAEEIVKIPSRLYSFEDKSFISLLKDTAYFELFDEIKRNMFLETLKKDPQYIKQWLRLSADKRCDSGWYFMEEKDEHIVGYLDSGKGRINETKYSDIREACANFIFREIEDIRNSESILKDMQDALSGN